MIYPFFPGSLAPVPELHVGVVGHAVLHKSSCAWGMGVESHDRAHRTVARGAPEGLGGGQSAMKRHSHYGSGSSGGGSVAPRLI